MKKSFSRLQQMINAALFAALIGIFAQFTIPIPHIPITGQTLGVGLAATILGAKQGTYAVVIYCFMGAVGLPVFSNLSSGLSVLFGPTGGYILGFIPTAYITGYILEKTSFRTSWAMVANVAGMIITLISGTLWYKWISNVSWPVAFFTGFFPFLIVGIIKAYMASVIGIAVRKQLVRAKLLQGDHQIPS